MRAENKRMRRFLRANGITATPKYINKGSLRGCWRLYNPRQAWGDSLRERLTVLGFVDFDGQPLSRFSGNAGLFQVFVRGHNELLEEVKGTVENLCRQCGRTFRMAYFEGEDEKMARGSYCLWCIVGIGEKEKR